MNTPIFRAVAPFLTALMLVFSVFVLLRGHNEPGGGFIGGLIAAAGFAILGIAAGVEAVRRAIVLHPLSLAGLGLLLSLAAGFLSAPLGLPFMTGIWVTLPIAGGIDLSSVMLFDCGVYLVVTGAVTAIALNLEEKGE